VVSKIYIIGQWVAHKTQFSQCMTAFRLACYWKWWWGVSWRLATGGNVLHQHNRRLTICCV